MKLPIDGFSQEKFDIHLYKMEIFKLVSFFVILWQQSFFLLQLHFTFWVIFYSSSFGEYLDSIKNLFGIYYIL